MMKSFTQEAVQEGQRGYNSLRIETPKSFAWDALSITKSQPDEIITRFIHPISVTAPSASDPGNPAHNLFIDCPCPLAAADPPPSSLFSAARNSLLSAVKTGLLSIGLIQTPSP